MGCKPHKSQTVKDQTRDVVTITLNADPAAPAKNIILLGAGETGKSTFKKQVLPHDKYELKSCVLATDLMVTRSLDSLVAHARKNHPLEEELPLLDRASAVITEYNSSRKETLESSAVTLLQQVWQLPSIQMAYWNRGRSRLHLPSTLPDCIASLERIHRADYVPSLNDLVKTSSRTCGITDSEFRFRDTDYCLSDVGGLRYERKKWHYMFENVSCLVFFAAIGAYDEFLCEDAQTMRLHEDLELWKEIANLERFQQIPKILVFSKMDIFYEKHRPPLPFTSLQQSMDSVIKNFPCAVLQVIHSYLTLPNLSICFPDYRCSPDEGTDTAIEFLKKKFLSDVHDQSLVTFTSLTTTDQDQCSTMLECLHRTLA